MDNREFFCSWSGGKDSCLALYRAIKNGGIPKLMFTMFTEDGVHSRCHGLHKNIIKGQAEALNIPLKTASATWNDYEDTFIKSLRDIKKQGIDAGVFGDIDLEESRNWVEKVCNQVSIQPYLPLWQEKRENLLNEFIKLEFKAIIVVLNEKKMDKNFLGQVLDKQLIERLQKVGIDPTGENGEFHTVVIDGPIFSHSVDIKLKDEIFKDGYWFLDIELCNINKGF